MSSTLVDSKPVVAACLAAEAAVRLRSCLDSLLSTAEQAQLGSFSSEKRRQDWLSGRLAAKAAVTRWLARRHVELPAPLIEIFNDDLGQPGVRMPPAVPDPPFLSISHCAAGGLAAVHQERVGLDWEPVAERDPAMLAYYLHDSERAQACRPEQQTALWTVKEAVLKLLGVGLAAGPTQVRWLDGRVELHGAARARWEELGSPSLSIEQGLAIKREPGGEIASALAFCS